MAKFTPVTNDQIKNLKSTGVYVQAFLAIFAHQFMDITPSNICGIGKFEGGITVNNREIVIYRDSVRDDFGMPGSETNPEEIATIKAIEKFQNEIDLTNEDTVEITMKDMYSKLTDTEQSLFQAFLQNRFRGDFLRNYLNISFNEII